MVKLLRHMLAELEGLMVVNNGGFRQQYIGN